MIPLAWQAAAPLPARMPLPIAVAALALVRIAALAGVAISRAAKALRPRLAGTLARPHRPAIATSARAMAPRGRAELATLVAGRLTHGELGVLPLRRLALRPRQGRAYQRAMDRAVVVALVLARVRCVERFGGRERIRRLRLGSVDLARFARGGIGGSVVL